MALGPEQERVRSQFHVLVAHLYDRLLNNEVFGEDATARLAELAYGIALPGVLVALFLFPAYHGLPPHPLERSFASQACDHLFFVTYAFAVMGGAVIFQWEMLFPDALDVSVMTTLPISPRRLLTGRVTAMTLFLLLVHAGTSGPGAVFLPAVADQRCGFFRQLLAQVTAVSMSAVCIVTALIAVQAVLLSLPKGHLAEVARGVVRVMVLTMLMTILFLFPLTAHSLQRLLADGGRATRWVPTFWFLGMYETVMWGGRAAPIFHALARTGVLAVACGLGAALVAYPLGYRRRVRQMVEGAALRGRAGSPAWLERVLHGVVFRTPRTRATAHLAMQTLLRTERLHLYLAMYAGLGTALVLSGVVALRSEGSDVRLVIVEDGLRMAVPIVAFWVVAGMKTALLSPVGQRGSWVFHVIGGAPGAEELRGARRLALSLATLLTLLSIVMLDGAAPRGVPDTRTVLAQVIFGCGVPVLLTELLFANVRGVPFTGAKKRSVNHLPMLFVRYFVVFPAFALSVAAMEARAAQSPVRLLGAAAGLALVCLGARELRLWLSARPEAEDELMLLGFHAD